MNLMDLRAKPSWRSVKSQIMVALMGAAVVAIAIPLVLVMYAVAVKGGAILFKDFPDFLTKDIPPTRHAGPGMGPAVVGTLIITGCATLIAVPLGVLGAIYLNEYGGTGRLARVVRFMSMVMTGVPSIVMGLFIYVVWTLTVKNLQAFGGALALSCLMLPVVINTSEQMLKLVPSSLREASYALGASKARTILTVVLPSAMTGIVSGALLAVARAAGETAPLMFTIGAAHEINAHLFDHENTALSKQIFDNAKQAVVNAQDRGWGAALTLVLLAFLADARRAARHRDRHPKEVAMVTEQRIEPTTPPAKTGLAAPVPEVRPSMVEGLMASPVVFDVKNLEVYYSAYKAVRGVNLQVRKNQITAFIGPSGCGKTTVLRCLNRMNDLIPGARVAGQVLYHDVDLYGPEVSATEVRRRIGMVFQKPNPFPKSIYDNVAFGPRINGITTRGKLDEIVEKSLRASALWDEVKDRLRNSALGMSGGQQQRLCIARTIAVEPEVVLMDEPCSALDPIATARIEDLMRELKSRFTIVIVTHNMQQAARTSDFTGFFTAQLDAGQRFGQLVEYDITSKIFSNPKDERTENYITGRFG